MLISYDSSAALGAVTAATNTAAFNNVAGDILFVSVMGDTSTDDITSVTYNGVAMTQIGPSVLVPSYRLIYLFYLANPATGNHNVVITFGSSHFNEGAAVSYSGAASSLPIDVSTTKTSASATTLSQSLTTTTSNDWTLMFGVCNNNVGGAITAGASTTLRIMQGSNNRAIFDSNGPIAVPGSTSLTFNQAGSADGMGLIITSFKPSVSGGTFLLNFV